MGLDFEGDKLLAIKEHCHIKKEFKKHGIIIGSCLWRFVMVFCLYAAILGFYLSAYMFTPFFALYMKELGGSYAEFAVVLSVTGFILSVIQSYIGYLSDKVGSRFLVIGGGIVSVIGFLMIGITYNKFLMIPLYLLLNVGMGILAPSLFTLISYQKTAKGNSFIPIYRSIQGAGVIIGPIVGGWFMRKSYRLNAVIGSSLMMISMLLFSVYFLKQDARVAEHNGSEKQKINFKDAVIKIFHNKSFVMIMLLFTCLELSYDLINMSLPIVGAELDFGTDIIGTALSAYFLMFTLFQIPINNALKKWKKRNALMFMGIASLIPCSLLLYNIPSYFTILIMGGIGLTVGSLFTFCSVLASEESPQDKKGTFMGVFNTIMPLTDVLSPIMAAFLIGINLKAPYVAAVFLIIVFVILSGLLYTNKERVD